MQTLHGQLFDTASLATLDITPIYGGEDYLVLEAKIQLFNKETQIAVPVELSGTVSRKDWDQNAGPWDETEHWVLGTVLSLPLEPHPRDIEPKQASKEQIRGLGDG